MLGPGPVSSVAEERTSTPEGIKQLIYLPRLNEQVQLETPPDASKSVESMKNPLFRSGCQVGVGVVVPLLVQPRHLNNI